MDNNNHDTHDGNSASSISSSNITLVKHDTIELKKLSTTDSSSHLVINGENESHPEYAEVGHDGIIDVVGPIAYFSYTNIFRYYIYLFGSAICLSLPAILMLWILSNLNYGDYMTKTFNPTAVTALLCIAMVAFGPGYIYFIGYLIEPGMIYDVKCRNIFLAISIICPLIYSLMTGYGFYSWFYYLDFIYFPVFFLPLSMYAGSFIESDKYFWIKFGICELMTIVSALSYTFFLFPVFLKQSDVGKVLWRVLLHPVWFELTMVWPSRVLIKSMKTNISWDKFLFSLHAIFHSVTIAPMLAFYVNDLYIMFLIVLITNIQEMILRLTSEFRDKFVIKYMKWTMIADEATMKELHGCILNVEMLIEISGIIISPVAMFLYSKFGFLFTFNIGHNTGNISYTVVTAITAEILTDLICSIVEIRKHRIDLLISWRRVSILKYFLFYVYGIATMAVMGMLYTMLLVPRSAYCKYADTYDNCTYTYN